LSDEMTRGVDLPLPNPLQFVRVISFRIAIRHAPKQSITLPPYQFSGTVACPAAPSLAPDAPIIDALTGFEASRSCWPPTDCTQKGAQQQTAWSQRTLTKQILIKQSSARSRHDCPHMMHTSLSNLQHRAFVIAHNLSCRAKPGSAIKTPTIKPSQRS
jgi:hypothetical protein